MKVFHHNDLDGRLSAAVVLMRYPEAQAIEVDYKNPFPFDKISDDEQVWIVDFSLQKPGDWDRLLKTTKNVIWIDHHSSAINQSGAQNQSRGFRSDKDGSAALLTWSYVFKKEPVPWIVKLVSDFDTWTHKYPESLDMMYGMKSQDDSATSQLWKDMMDPEREVLRNVLQIGAHVRKAWENTDKEYLERYGFATTFLGHSALVVNRGMTSSLMFGKRADEYDLLVAYAHDGKRYAVSVYTTKKDIDVGELLKKSYGGGGHRGCGGFTADEVPFA